MASLIASVIPLALGAAVSPTILGAVVLILASGLHPLVRAGAFAVGAAIPLVLIGLTCLFLLGRAVRTHQLQISGAVDLAFGVGLLLLATRLLVNAAAVDRQESQVDRQDATLGGGTAKAAILGGAMMATNVTTLALFVPAVKNIAQAAYVGLGGQLTTFIVLLVITLLVVLLPPLLYAIKPRRALELFRPLRSAATNTQRSRLIRGAVPAIFGAYLTIKGVGAFL